MVAQTAFKKILESMGFPVDAGKVAYNAWAEYLKNPDDTKLDATLQSLGQGIAGLAFPNLGMAMEGGKLVIGGVQYTIEEAQSAQLGAFLCGGASFGQAFTSVDFFSLNAVQAQSPGLNCDNFGDRVTSLEKLYALKSIWDGYYTRQLLEIAGPANSEEIKMNLYQGWTTLETKWKLQQGAVILARLRDKLRQEAEAIPKTCELPPTNPLTIADPRTDRGNFVDRCLYFGSQCDDNGNGDPAAKPAANEYCKKKGYGSVAPSGSTWSYKAPTEILSTGEICGDPNGCGGLDFVTCI
jgi:hypothetical protein